MKKAFQSLSSSESVDFRALLLSDAKKDITLNELQKRINPADCNNGVNHMLSPDAGGQVAHRRESDTESGFEDSGSQMSKSLNDDCGNSARNSAHMSDSDSSENLQIEQLLLELQSIAVEWKSLRNVKACSCAMPFEHFTKKVSYFSAVFLLI